MDSDSYDQGRGHLAPHIRLVKNFLLAIGILALMIAAVCIVGSMAADDSDAEMIESKDLEVGYRYWKDISFVPEWKSFEGGRYVHYDSSVELGKRLSADNTDGADVIAEYDEASGTLYVRGNLTLVHSNDKNGSLKIVALCDNLQLDGVSGMSDLELTSTERYSMDFKPRLSCLRYNSLTISGNLSVKTGDPFDYWDSSWFEELYQRYYIETGTLTLKDNASLYGVVDMEDFMDDEFFDFSGMNLSELEDSDNDHYGLLAILKTNHMIVNTNGTVEVGLERYDSVNNGTKLPAFMLIVLDNLDFIKCKEFVIYNAYVYDVDPTAHFIDDAEFMSKVKSNTLTGYTCSISDVDIYDEPCKVLRVVRDTQIIDGVAVTVTAPAFGQQPGVPTESDGRFDISSYEWTPNTVFGANQDYTLRVMLRQDDSHYTFGGMTATINGENATVVSSEDQYAVISYVFHVPPLNVSFNNNGGSGTMTDAETGSGAYSLPTCTFVPPTGKHFKAWAAGSASNAQYAVGEKYNLSGDTTFYAVWEDNGFTRQPIDKIGKYDGTPEQKTISEVWEVDFDAVRYVVREGDTDYAEPLSEYFEISSDTERTRIFKIRAYYGPGANDFVESQAFTLTWVTSWHIVQYQPEGDGGAGSPVPYYVPDHGSTTIMAFEDSGLSAVTGYKFDHWRYDGNNRETGYIIEDITEDITVYAVYVKKDATNLDVEYTGGNVLLGNMIDTDKMIMILHYDDGSSDQLDYHQAQYKIGTTDIMNIDTYDGWSVGDVAVTVISEEVSDTMVIHVIGYTVSFDKNTGKGMMAPLTDRYGNTTLPSTTGFIAPDGQCLVKWALGSPAGTQYDLGASYDVTGDVTFYAVWADKTPESLTAAYQTMGSLGRRIDISAIDITLRYTDGSSDTVDKLAATYWLNAQQIPDITKYLFDKEGASPITVKYEGLQTAMDITVVSDCVVKFDRDGGKGIMSSAVCGKNGSYVLPECGFTAPASKVFKCWSVAGAEKKVGDTITVAADVTVKAVWKDIPADEPEFTPSEVDGKKVYTNTVDEGKDTNVSTIFNTAKTNSGTVEVKVGTMNISFDSNAVNAIGGNTVSLKAEVKTTGLDVEGAQAVIEVSLDGAKFDAGTAKVTIPFANEVPSGKVPVVYFIDGDKKEKMDTTFEDGKVVFTTNHFSKYAIMFDDVPSGSNGGGFPVWAIVLIVVVVFAAVGGAGAFFIMKNKKA